MPAKFCAGVNAARGIVEYKEDGSIIFLLSQKIFHCKLFTIPVRKLDHDSGKIIRVYKAPITHTRP
jgi:hypothetical protein